MNLSVGDKVDIEFSQLAVGGEVLIVGGNSSINMERIS